MAGWLYAVDAQGLLVTPAFVERLRSGRASAFRELAKLDLTALYRSRHSKLTRKQMQPGLFWSDDLPPDHVVIPFVRGGQHPPPSMIPDYVVYQGDADKRGMRIARKSRKEPVQVKFSGK